MAAEYLREEETTVVVRFKAKAPLDGTADVFQMLAWARQELNKHLGKEDRDQDPGYGRIWLEPVGCEGDSDAGVAVCFEKSTTRSGGENGGS